MRRPSYNGYYNYWSVEEAIALVLSADELTQFNALYKRGKELEKEWDKLWFIGPFRSGYKDVAGYRQQARELEQHPQPTTNYPPPLIADPKDRFGRLRVEIRVWEREIAEVRDTIASPTALRYLSDLLKAKRRQWREEERKRQEQERLKQQERSEQNWRAFREMMRNGRETAQEDLATLGVSEKATKEQINQRYRELVKMLHPDITDGSAEKIEMFHRVTSAMERLRERGRA